VIDRTARVSTTVVIAKGDVMKKVICALMLALFVGGVMSCKKTDTTVAPPTPATPAPAPAPEKPATE
jgi:hypothetical protein